MEEGARSFHLLTFSLHVQRGLEYLLNLVKFLLNLFKFFENGNGDLLKYLLNLLKFILNLSFYLIYLKLSSYLTSLISYFT